MKEYVWLHHLNIDYNKYPYLKSYKSVMGLWEFPVDRYSIIEEGLGIPCANLVPPAEFNLSNLTDDWKDRYFSALDSAADEIYRIADSIPGPNGRRTVTVLYSGGVDSLVALVALQRHPSYQSFLDEGKFKLAMTNGSITEYPEFFYKEILPKIPITALFFDQLMNDDDALLVTGDMGDYTIGSSDSMALTGGDKTFDLMGSWETLIPYIKEKPFSDKFIDIIQQAKKKEPFEIVSACQMFWWLSQCFSFQDDFAKPYFWSNTNSLSSMPTNNKVYRFFYNKDITSVSYEYMSTNPIFKNYEDARIWPKEYIINHTGDESYKDKPKVYSQRSTLRLMNKTQIYIEDGVYKHTKTSEAI
jgi:hypothetical protein